MPVVPAFLSSPEAAFVLLAFAALGIVLEIAVPGVGLGALGALVLVALSGWALTEVPPRPIGLFLALLAAALLTAGVFLPRRALWAAAGGVALLLAGLTLFPRPVSAAVLLPVAVGVPAAAAVLGRLVAGAWRTPPYQGTAGTLVGMVGEVRQGAPAGEPVRVYVAGSLWGARAEQDLQTGDPVIIVAQDNVALRVARQPDSPT